jgi:serine/threonine protein kinase
MASQLHPGDYVAGEYRVMKVFGGEGKSGMGVVYLVEHRSFYEPFVLKTYQSSTLGERKTRFRKEAETWVQLGSHPNIVRCLWVNEIDGDLFVAAEYIARDEDGFSTLEDRLRLGKIPLEKQLQWSAEFCFAAFALRSVISTPPRFERDYSARATLAIFVETHRPRTYERDPAASRKPSLHAIRESRIASSRLMSFARALPLKAMLTRSLPLI